jgi:hypothetical protein
MKTILFLVLILFPGIANAQSLEEIQWISEDYPLLTLWTKME